jgi:hypothetical protein
MSEWELDVVFIHLRESHTTIPNFPAKVDPREQISGGVLYCSHDPSQDFRQVNGTPDAETPQVLDPQEQDFNEIPQFLGTLSA